MKIPDHQTSTFFRRDGGLQEDTELTFIIPGYVLQHISGLVLSGYKQLPSTTFLTSGSSD